MGARSTVCCLLARQHYHSNSFIPLAIIRGADIMLYCPPVVGLILLVSIEIKLCIFILRQSNGPRGTGGPKGKMSEGRSGGSGRGTRRELWAPPDSGSAQPADRTLYRVPTLDPAAHSFPSLRRFLTRRTCLLATGKNSAAPKRTFSSALVSAA